MTTGTPCRSNFNYYSHAFRDNEFEQDAQITAAETTTVSFDGEKRVLEQLDQGPSIVDHDDEVDGGLMAIMKKAKNKKKKEIVADAAEAEQAGAVPSEGDTEIRIKSKKEKERERKERAKQQKKKQSGGKSKASDDLEVDEVTASTGSLTVEEEASNAPAVNAPKAKGGKRKGGPPVAALRVRLRCESFS